jgi:hypothetical protein
VAPRKFQKGLYVPGIDGPTETPLRLATDRKAEIERQAKMARRKSFEFGGRGACLVEDMAGGRGLKVLLERSIYRLFERNRFEKSGGLEADFERVRGTVDGYRVAAGYACEERLNYLSVKQSHASSAQQFQSLSDQILAANGYLGVV